MRVLSIGECMIELVEAAPGLLAHGFGGDTLNTAVYLARLGVAVDYATALGYDPWSEQMLSCWRSEGVGSERVIRLPGLLPGLYIIRTGASGERSFAYWRDNSAARRLFGSELAANILPGLGDYDVIYLSGITLALYAPEGRAELFRALGEVKSAGRKLVFDTNFRSNRWPDRTAAQDAFRQAMALADMIFASDEDLDLLFGERGLEELLARRQGAELILKTGEPACRIISGPTDIVVPATPAEDVVDTTAAGDSFAAAYLAARFSGADPARAARAGHRLAGAVIRRQGAIIPRDAMPAVAADS